MCKDFPNIRITEGNNFSLILPLRSRTYVATKPIDEEIDPEQLENVVVTFGGIEYSPQLTEQGVQINLPATLAVGTYNILLTADYFGSNIRAAYESAVTIVPWSAQSTAEQYVIGSPIVLRAAYVLSGAMTDAELEELKEEYREKNAQLDEAIAEAEEAKSEWERKAEQLDNVAQETTSQEILTKTNAAKNAAQSAASDANAAKIAAQALSPMASAAEAYNTGKVELAAAISAKGVETSPTETYPQMAEKVNAISQETYEINGGEMYAKQLFGSLTTPNYWNLYEVLANLLSDGRLVNYGGILLAEYYRGYDSLALSGAGAGGAYVVSDKDGDGNFIMYTSDTTHTWATEFDGKCNRWVAYCFADEYHDFQITNTNTSPRSIFIGRKVGAIESLVDGRISDVVVSDGNELNAFNTNNFAQNWQRRVVIRNLKNQSGSLIKLSNTIENVYIQCETAAGTIFTGTVGNMNLASVIVNVKEPNDFSLATQNSGTFGKLATLCICGCNGGTFIMPRFNEFSLLNQICLLDIEGLELVWSFVLNCAPLLTRIYIGYQTNDKSKEVYLNFSYGNPGQNNIDDIELQNGWNKPLRLHSFLNLLTEANMYAHILQRLKQDEADCGDGITITLGATNLAKLTSAESVQLLDDLTNIYGYTFA